MDTEYVIEGPARTGGVRALWRHRELVWSLTLREVQVRYRQAVMGVLWAGVQPLGLMVVTTIVFDVVLGVDVGGRPYPVVVFGGLVAWTFFNTAVTAAVPSFVNSAYLVKKIWFPREALPLASVFAVLLDLGVGLLVWVVLLWAWGYPPTPALLALPILLAILLCTTLAWALLGSAVNVYYRDVKHALPFLLQVAFFATPIVYPLMNVPPPWRNWLYLNPLTAVVEGMRCIGISHRWPPFDLVAMGLLVSVTMLLVAYAIFRRAERRFADVV